MTKRKSIITKLLLALVILTLISFCFLGNTFARYTSNGTGSATVNVAKWDVALSSATTTTSVKLSPSQDAYAAGKTRSNSTKELKVAVIKNSGDVDALVTLDFAVDAASIAEAIPEPVDEAYKDFSETDIVGLFSVTFYTAVTTEGSDDVTYTKVPEQGVSVETGGSLDIYAVYTWTTNDTDGNGDLLDTFVGTYIEKIPFTISYNAVQNSTQPA